MSTSVLIQQTDKLLADAQESLAAANAATIHWADQVERLTKAKEQLASLFPNTDAPQAKFKAGSKKEAKPGKAVTIPSTDKNFWLGLITDQPQKTADITAAAARAKGIDEHDEDKIKLLKQRQASFLQTALEEQLISSEGERLNRVYFKKAA